MREDSGEEEKGDPQTDIAFQVEIRMIDLLRTSDLWRFVRVVGVDVKGEVELAAFVDTSRSTSLLLPPLPRSRNT